FNWIDDQKRPTKDSTWNITDTLNPIYVFRYSYESNAAGQSLKETRELWLSSEPKWAKNREIIYTYDTNGCRTTQTICYSNKYETNCSTTQYQRNLDCTLQRETRPDITDILHTANADSSERNTLILNWDRPTQEWVARNYRTNYYDQWGYFAGSFNTNFPDSSQSEQIIINDSAGNILYSRQGEKTPGQAWQYSFEYELIEDSETYLSYRRYKQWDPDTEAFHNRVWYTTEKDPSSGIWKYQELDSSLVNGIWVESAYRSRIFHQYYCNDLLREYEEYLGWDDLTEPLEKETYGYQLEDIPCQGTPSPESLILYPNPTTDFLKFRSRDVLQMTGVRWQVVDLSGRVIQKGVLQLDDQAIVDVRGLAQGPYYLYVGERESRASYMFFRQ
ncbi:MAG: T9SS type A sorting domain-containing protein, partial [Bacteroidota bacterium]